MRLKNKKTGEIVYATMMASYGGGELQIRYYPVDNAEDTQFKEYRSVSELNEEWEDYEEPKEYWYVDSNGNVNSCIRDGVFDESAKEIGDYFETEKQAEKAVEKLKAWKRLKDKGFEFERWQTWEKVRGLACFDRGVAHSYYAGFTFRNEDRLEKDEQVKADLDLLFGGEE